MPKRTSEANTYWKSIFDNYCRESLGEPVDFATLTAPNLAKIMEAFFVDVRAKNGQVY